MGELSFPLGDEPWAGEEPPPFGEVPPPGLGEELRGPGETPLSIDGDVACRLMALGLRRASS